MANKAFEASMRAIFSKKNQLIKKNKTDNSQFVSTKKAKAFEKLPNGASQDDVPIKRVAMGIIQTTDNRYVSIIEAFPINFNNMSVISKNRVLNSFGPLFRVCPTLVDFKITSGFSNPRRLKENIKRSCKNQDLPIIQESLKDCFALIDELSETASISHHYYIIFEYDGDAKGHKSSVYEEIAQSMYETRFQIVNVLLNCGVVCNMPDNYDEFLVETLYCNYNKKSCEKYSYIDRIHRIHYDREVFNEKSDAPRNIAYADYIAPKGLYFTNRNYHMMDGEYYTYLALDPNSYPSEVPANWLSIFYFSTWVDIDLIKKKLPHDLTMLALNQYNKITDQSMKASNEKGKVNKFRKLRDKYINNSQTYQAMANGDDLNDCIIILTIRADSPKDLISRKNMVEKSLGGHQLQFNDAFLQVEEFFRMTSMLLCIESPFRQNAHNILSSNLESIFCFTSYEMKDDNGFVLGINAQNNSLVSLNNFNTKYFKNANILILGTSGSGKTFTINTIAFNQLMAGKRCFFIIPKKGWEDYRRGALNIGGEFISLVPGSKDCVNILGIIPEDEIDASVLDEADVVKKDSLVGKKISAIIVWFQLLLVDSRFANAEDRLSKREYNRLVVVLKQMYEKFGITDDNNSIYEDVEKKVLKKMPIISDFKAALEEDEMLHDRAFNLDIFITGSASNMNGQTNVDLNNNYIVFDVDEDTIGEQMLPSFLYIAFDFVYSNVRANTKTQDEIIMDEVWKMMKVPDCAAQVQNMVKIVRGYGGGVIIATQEMEDMAKSEGGFGKSVLNNAYIKLILNMTEEGVEFVRNDLKLTEEDAEAILQFPTGHGMLIANGNKVHVQIKASQRMFKAFDNDSNNRIVKNA